MSAEALAALAVALGAGWASGLNTYAAVLVLGSTRGPCVRSNWMERPDVELVQIKDGNGRGISTMDAGAATLTVERR